MLISKQLKLLEKNKYLIKSNNLPIGTGYESLYRTNVLRNRRFISRIFKQKNIKRRLVKSFLNERNICEF